jgi:hypothetical protein
MSKLTPLILIVFSVIAFFAFIDPEYEKVKTLRAEKAQYDVVLAKARTLLSKRDALQEKYREISPADLARIQAMLPDNIDNVRLVLDVDRMASTYGMAIKNISINNTGKATQESKDKKVVVNDSKLYDSATITFGISAPYDVFQKFLRDLEDGLRLIDVSAVSIATKDPRIYDYTITFKTYWLK